MNEKIKVLFLQVLMISTGIVAVMSIEGVVYHLMGDTFMLDWYHPLSILVAAVLCTIPSVLFSGFEEWPKSKFMVRLVIHALILYAVVAGLGYLFHWYSAFSGFICVSIGYFFVYVFVWVVTMWTNKRAANEINVALDNIRDEE